VAAVAKAVGAPVDVLGQSSGAHVALHAARRTAQVQRLVLYEPPRLDAFTSSVRARLHASLEAGDLDSIVATVLVDVVVSTTNPGLLPNARPQVLAGLRQSAVWAGALRNARAIPVEADSYATYRFDPVEFRDFTTATVLLLGSTSGPVVQGWLQDLQAALPSSRIVVMKGQARGAMHEAPELFVRIVRAALA